MKNQDLILLDLFSGMGGFHLGLEEAGLNFKKVYFSEVDKHAIANYKYNFNEAEHIGSVEHILDSGIERPNIITFGSPCQDFSLAGKRKGMDGDRSSLIEYAISLISHFRPDIYIWENVKGTFSSNAGEDFWAIIQAFANIGGYELEWQLVNTSWILPQNRERIYLVGHLTESFRDWEGVFPIEEDEEAANQENRTNRDRVQAENCSTIGIGYGNRPTDTYVKCRDIAGCLTGGGHSGGLHSDMEVVIQVNSATKQGFEEANTGEDSKTRRGRVGKGVAQTLDCNCNQGVFLSEPTHKHGEERMYKNTAPTIQARYGTGGDNIPYVNNIRRLTEIECERLQGFPDDWTKWGLYPRKELLKYIFTDKRIWKPDHVIAKLYNHIINNTKLELVEISKTQRYKMCGNAVTAKKVTNIGRRIKVNFK